MRTNPPTNFKTHNQSLIQETFSKVIPRIWLFCFDATCMLYAQRGIPLEEVRIGNRNIPGFEIVIYPTHLTVVYDDQEYQVDWNYDSVTGEFSDFTLSSNWNSSFAVFALVMESIVDHTVKISQQVQVR